jgi:enterochelin esterase-like enzyme
VIHGGGGGPLSWFTGEATKDLDRLFSQKEIDPFIVVSPFLPYDNFSHVPWLTGELVPLIDDTYRTKTDRLYRAIAGRSLGGAEAQWQAFQSPETFGALQLISSLSINSFIPLARPEGVIGYDAFLPAVPDEFMLHIYNDIGDEDGLLPQNLNMLLYFKEYGLPLTHSVNPGGHRHVYWNAHFEEYMRWFDTVWGIPAERMEHK